MTHALLPSGLQDLLPPDAAREQRMITELLQCFAQQGYLQVTPPLVEFEETLLEGKGRAYQTQTFRVADPLSQKMMGLRADITTQVARIASTLLAGEPKPLRLSYAGRVLRTVPQALTPDRQLVQSGIELIGADSPEALAEIVLLCRDALTRIGCGELVVDFTLAGLLDEVLAGIAFASTEERDRIIAAVKRKDKAALPPELPVHDLLVALLSLPADTAKALKQMRSLPLPARVVGWCHQLASLLALLQAEAPGLRLSVDALESHGFEYQEGICFSLFDARHGREVGRGGRYVIQEAPETVIAVGATLYIRALLECGYLPVEAPKRVLVAKGTPLEEAQRLRAEGYVTVRQLGELPEQEAQAQQCGFLWQAGALRLVKP